MMRGLKDLWVMAIRDERSLRRYTLRITGLSAALALMLDVVNQLVFFTGWPDATRSWLVTLLVSGSIASVASRAIGRAQLELWRTKEDVERLSRTDSLTGLLNRRALLDKEALPDAMTLVIADIDRFKQVNDTHGHLVGDDVIRTVSRLMVEHLGNLGSVGRLGGEEFAVVMSAVPLDRLTRRLETFKAAVEKTTVSTRGAAVRITISAGLAYRREGQSFDALYAEADRALYVAKTTGRNQIVVAEVGSPSGLCVPLAPTPARWAA